MRYALLAYEPVGTWDALSDAERAAYTADYVELEAALAAEGALVASEALAPADVASTVRVRGAAAISDGPFAETDDVLGGFLVVDVDDLDAALAVARRCPTARTGCVEVRPVA